MLFYFIIIVVTVLLYIVYLIPTLYLCEGHGDSYWLLLFSLPFSTIFVVATPFMLVAMLVGIFHGVESIIQDGNISIILLSLFGGFFIIIVFFFFCVPVFQKVSSLGPPPLGYPLGGAIPYALAFCCVAPGLVAITGLTLALMVRIAGGVVTVPLLGFCRFVYKSPVRAGYLVSIPPIVVELICQTLEFLNRLGK